jgi:polyhydroxyalkanoate synthesis repressor PhaR
MSEPRVIKKCSNRRLYDTVAGRFITLSDIRELVVERIDFVATDKGTNQDITQSVLLQIVAALERRADPLMTEEFLTDIIRAHGDTRQAQVGSYIEQSLNLFAAG